MLTLPLHDNTGKLACGVLHCSCALAQQNWIRRLRRIGFDRIITYHDIQSPHSIMFGSTTRFAKRPVRTEK